MDPSADGHRSPPPYPSLPPSILCFGLFLTLFVCSPLNAQSASPEATTFSYSVQLNANLGSDQNGGGFVNANLSVSGANSSTIASTTTNKPSTSTTARTTTTTATATILAAKSPFVPSGTSLKYGLAFPLNILCTFLQLYVSFFGRRMQMNGIRWFTIYYNLWNIYQIMIVSDTVNNSPWRGWLNDTRIQANRESLELLTMSFFPLGLILLIPLLLFSHFCFSCPFRWIPWLPIFILLSLLPTFLYNGGFFNFNLPLIKGNSTLDMGNGTVVDSVQAYAFTVICFALFSFIYLIPMIFVAIFFFLCYRLLNRFNPKSNHSLRASRMLDLVSLLPFLLVILAVHAPSFVINLSGFFVANIYPTLSTTLIPILTGTGTQNAVGNSTAAPPITNPFTSSWMMSVLNAYNQILLYKDDSLMFLPIVEFLASIIFVRMYREQYLGLLSCFACYKNDRDGAFGICCKRRPLMAQIVHPMPQDPQLWAQPVGKK